MPLFEENPAHLPKSRLRSDLVAHNVALPPAKSKKEVYVELHLKHVDHSNAPDFSSDEEDQVQNVANNEEEADDAEIPDPSDLTDDDLRAALLKHGVKVGPIVASTRALYENKLRKLLQSNGHSHVNREEKGVLYSDSEEEEEGSEGENEEAVEQTDQAQHKSSQRAPAPRSRETCPKWNSGNALKSSEWSQSRCSQIPVGISRTSSVEQRSGLGSAAPSGSSMPSGRSSSSSQPFSITQMVEEMESRKSLSTSTNTERELNGSNVHEHWSRSNRLDTLIADTDSTKNQSLYYTPVACPYKWGTKPPQEPVKDILKDVFPDTQATPTGIYATCRRPIKGAAARPVLYEYPDTPSSPATLERREDNPFSPLVALLDSPNHVSDSEEGFSLQAEAQDTPALSGQE